MTEPVGVVGAGTMGAGIAQVAAVAGRRVLVVDSVPGAAERAIAKIRDRVTAQVEKGRLDADPAALDLSAVEIAGLGECGVVVEAIVEELEAKQALFAELEGVVGADCILASNSSSLTPTAMAAGLSVYPRVAGTASGLVGFLQMAISALGTLILGGLPRDGGFAMAGLVLATQLIACILGVIAVRLPAMATTGSGLVAGSTHRRQPTG